MKAVKINRIGFTLIEVLMATVVTALFIGAAFSLYSMSGKLFTSGTWRQNTQKQAEMLLAQISADVSKATIPVVVDYNTGMVKGTAKLCYKNNYSLPANKDESSTIELLSFPICKSSITAKKAADNESGVIKYNALFATKGKEKGVCQLRYISVDQATYASGGMPTTKNSFVGGSIDLTKFNGDSVALGLGTSNQVKTLDYVNSVQISKRSNNTENNEGNIIEIVINCLYPNHKETKLTVRMAAGVDKSVTIENL